MTNAKELVTKPAAGSCNPILTLGGRISQTTSLVMLVAVAIGAGLFFGWDSLAALGLTGVIVSVLPCLLMCAAGVCASRLGKK
jgi:hypothetical protein